MMSIRNTICWSQIVLQSTLITLFCIGLYWFVEGVLTDQFEQQLESSSQSLQNRLTVTEEDGETYIQLTGEVQSDLVFKIASSSGYVIYSSGSSEFENSENFFDGMVDCSLSNGDSAKYFQVTLKGRERELDGWKVLVAKSTVSVRKPLEVLIKGSIVCGSALVCLSGLFAYLNVKRGLRPLNQLASRVEQIDENHLDLRFETKEVPEELLVISKRLNQLLDRLALTFERERRFSANVAHELRTPITEVKAIAQVGELWQPGSSDGEDPREYFRDVVEVTERMQALVEGLLQMVRAEAGSFTIKRKPVDLIGYLRSCKATNESKVAVKFVISQLIILADIAVLDAILTNLLSNAIKYGEGKVMLAVERDNESSEIQADNDYYIEIQNGCTSLRNEDLVNICDPFWRKDISRTSGTNLGLGLALVKAYCESHSWSFELVLIEEVLKAKIVIPSSQIVKEKI